MFDDQANYPTPPKGTPVTKAQQAIVGKGCAWLIIAVGASALIALLVVLWRVIL